jgi:methanogenic corrinoid protein MtbC1
VNLPEADLRILVETDGAAAPSAAESAGGAEAGAERARAAALAAGERLDGESVYTVLMKSVVALTPREFMASVLSPLLLEVGERWHAGRLGAAQEHVVSDAARRVLWWMVQAYERSDAGPLLVVTTPSGEQHELGAMMAAITALGEGWRVMYLGCSLPASEIAAAARRTGAAAVALSLVNRADASADVQDLSAMLPPDVALLAGGSGALAQRGALERSGARVLADLEDLRGLLRRDGRWSEGALA